MLCIHILEAHKLEYKGAILSMPNPPQTTMDRPKTWHNELYTFTRLSLIHARAKANYLWNIKAITRHYMVGMLSMQGVPNPTHNKVISRHNKYGK